jgi:hypothetical protein
MRMSLSGASSVAMIFHNLLLHFPDGRIDRSPLTTLPDGRTIPSPAEAGTAEAARIQQEYVEAIQDARVLTPELARVIPPLYANEEVKDPLVIAKIFNPAFSWTWYVTEGSLTDENGIMMEPGEQNEGGPTDYTFFGLVKGFEEELGYFTLKQFREIEQATGLCMERDLYFTPAPLSAIRSRSY